VSLTFRLFLDAHSPILLLKCWPPAPAGCL
jgi:hypothetical protein